jgi:sortase (surface protein transpeptidase)
MKSLKALRSMVSLIRDEVETRKTVNKPDQDILEKQVGRGELHVITCQRSRATRQN